LQPVNPTFSPLYQQIKGLLLKSLQEGEWKPGELIPSETELAARYGVSQGTVRKAIDELAAENLVDLAADEEPGVKPKSTYLSVERVRASSQIAKLLDIKPSDAVFVVKRVMRFDGVPRIFDEIWLPASQYKGLTLERLQQWDSTLYGFLESSFNVRMLRAKEHIKAVSAQPEHSAILQVEVGTPLLLVERLSMTYADQPVELRRGWYLTDKFSYRNELY